RRPARVPPAPVSTRRQSPAHAGHRLHRRAPSFRLRRASADGAFRERSGRRAGVRSPRSRTAVSKRLTGSLQWLLPGLRIKRWVLLAALGIALLLDAITRWLIAEGAGIHINEVLDDIVDDYFSPAYLTWIFAIAGVVFTVLGIRLWLQSV